MTQHINITLPEEILADLGKEDLSAKAKEAGLDKKPSVSAFGISVS